MFIHTNNLFLVILSAVITIATTASGFLLWKWQRNLSFSQAMRLFLLIAFPTTISLFALRSLAGNNAYPLEEVIAPVAIVFITLFVQFSFAGNYGPFSSEREILKIFDAQATVIDKSVKTQDKEWYIPTANGTIELFVYEPEQDLHNSMLIYEAQIKTKNTKKVYLEMWVRIGNKEYFSRGVQFPICGDEDWQTTTTPFFLNNRQSPNRIRFNIVAEEMGEIWLKDIGLYIRRSL